MTIQQHFYNIDFKAHHNKKAFRCFDDVCNLDHLSDLYPHIGQVQKQGHLLSGEEHHHIDLFLEGKKDIYVLGTGGSSLAGQMLQSVNRKKLPYHVHFIDNIDPDNWFVPDAPSESDGFIVISKSGNTPETVCQFLTVLDPLVQKFGHDLNRHVLMITRDQSSSLYDFGQKYKCSFLKHHPLTSGRYSVFSMLGAFYLKLFQMDVDAFFAGCHDFLTQELIRNNHEGIAFQSLIFHHAMMQRYTPGTHVMQIYADRLSLCGDWYKQLWSESIGKNGHGSMPVVVRGTVDQHSQQQLFLDGPDDKYYSFLYVDGLSPRPRPNKQDPSQIYPSHNATRPIADMFVDNHHELDYFYHRSMHDLWRAEYRATIKTLARHQKPIREIVIDYYDDYHVGQLCMLFALETILCCKLYDVNPFDQPAVEEGKVLARQMLRDRLDVDHITHISSKVSKQ